jgi:hypothetical protein
MARSSRRSASEESSQKARICWVFICELEKMGLAGRGGARWCVRDRARAKRRAGARGRPGRGCGSRPSLRRRRRRAAPYIARRDLDVDVDAVEQRAGDLADVALDHGRGTHAVARLVVEVAAGAGVHGGGEHEARGKLRLMAARAMVTVPSSSGWRRTSRTLRGNSGSSSRKEQAVVGERDLAGPRDHAAADQAGVGDGVVRRAEGPVVTRPWSASSTPATEWILVVSSASSKAQRREDGGQPLGQHGLARAGRADHQDVVAAGGGDLQARAWRHAGRGRP